MVTLANVQGSSLVPNLDTALGTALQAFGTPQTREDRERRIAQEDEEIRRRKEIEDLIGTIGQPGAKKSPNQKALLRLQALDPKIGKAVLEVIKNGTEQDRETFKLEAERGAKQAVFVASQTDFAAKQRAIRSLAAQAAAQGKPLDRFIELQNLSEPELDLELQRMKIAGADLKTILGGQGRFTKGIGVIVRLPDGGSARSVPVLNQATGQLENRVIPLGGEPISRLGETGQEQTTRQIFQAGGTAAATRGVELETAQPIAAATTRGRAAEKRQQSTINEGFTAADAIPILNRSIALLNSVETGGFARASLAAKQLLGIESADEAELSANLGKTVLSQLRSTFGAAFTEREGARLARIEAAFGKSPAGNRRLLRQTKRLMERVANRAIRAAERTGDTETAQEIRDAMVFSLDLGVQEGTAKPASEMTDAELLEALR